MKNCEEMIQSRSPETQLSFSTEHEPGQGWCLKRL